MLKTESIKSDLPSTFWPNSPSLSALLPVAVGASCSKRVMAAGFPFPTESEYSSHKDSLRPTALTHTHWPSLTLTQTGFIVPTRPPPTVDGEFSRTGSFTI